MDREYDSDEDSDDSPDSRDIDDISTNDDESIVELRDEYNKIEETLNKLQAKVDQLANAKRYEYY